VVAAVVIFKLLGALGFLHGQEHNKVLSVHDGVIGWRRLHGLDVTIQCLGGEKLHARRRRSLAFGRRSEQPRVGERETGCRGNGCCDKKIAPARFQSCIFRFRIFHGFAPASVKHLRLRSVSR